MGRAPALSLAAAREAYVRANPRSLAHHINADGPTGGVVPFPLVIVATAAGRAITADGRTLIDCRGDTPPPAWTGETLRALFYLDLWAAGLLITPTGAFGRPRDCWHAERLASAIADFARARPGALPLDPSKGSPLQSIS